MPARDRVSAQRFDAFAFWATDVLRPSPWLQSRLAHRLWSETGIQLMPPTPLWREPEWTEVAPGISCQLLATDADKHLVSMLVRLAPHAEYPHHTHAGAEELYLLDGELTIDDRQLYPGDYNTAQPGTSDRRVRSETGCTCVLITSTNDAIE